MKLNLYCSCGNIAEGEVEPDTAAETFKRIWEWVHSQASGCKPCTREEAIAAMAPEDRPEAA